MCVDLVFAAHFKHFCKLNDFLNLSLARELEIIYDTVREAPRLGGWKFIMFYIWCFQD